MTRLLIHVEGPTEESFVNTILREHLYNFGYDMVSARLLGNSRARERRGGIKHWHVVREEIRRHLASDGGAIAATMVDYYALPDNWPGRGHAATRPLQERGETVHQHVLADFDAFSGLGHRFEPLILMHEFEALLFSDCIKFAEGIGLPHLAGHFQQIRDQFATPEDINDSPQTAPSKRVLSVVPGYQKPLFGTAAALEIGLQKIRTECPHFHAWLKRLEDKLA